MQISSSPAPEILSWKSVICKQLRGFWCSASTGWHLRASDQKRVGGWSPHSSGPGSARLPLLPPCPAALGPAGGQMCPPNSPLDHLAMVQVSVG